MRSSAICEELLTHLRWELEHLRLEKDLLLKERLSLLRQDFDGILETVKEKQTLRTQGKILEECRVTMGEKLRCCIPHGEGDVSLSKVIQGAEEPTRSHLARCKVEMEELLEQIRILSEGNHYLIGSALGHVTKSLEFLEGLRPCGQGFYGGDGRTRGDSPGPSVERRA